VNPQIQKLGKLLELVGREQQHLLAVRARLLAGQAAEGLTEPWLAAHLGRAEGIDRLESFYAKFSRMQDTVADKLLPALLEASGESPGSAIDNLDRAARLKFLSDPDQWLGIRRLRNRLVHEYVESAQDMLMALRETLLFVDILSAAFQAMQKYAEARFDFADVKTPRNDPSGPKRG
jgi:hypothetical protein